MIGKEQKTSPIRISVDDAKQQYDQGNVIMLDVVDSDSYDKIPYQIKGAVRIKPEEIREQYTRLSRDRTVLAY